MKFFEKEYLVSVIGRWHIQYANELAESWGICQPVSQNYSAQDAAPSQQDQQNPLYSNSDYQASSFALYGSSKETQYDPVSPRYIGLEKEIQYSSAERKSLQKSILNFLKRAAASLEEDCDDSEPGEQAKTRGINKSQRRQERRRERSMLRQSFDLAALVRTALNRELNLNRAVVRALNTVKN